MECVALEPSYVLPKTFCTKSIKTGFMIFFHIGTNSSRLGLDVSTSTHYINYSSFRLKNKKRLNLSQ